MLVLGAVLGAGLLGVALLTLSPSAHTTAIGIILGCVCAVALIAAADIGLALVASWRSTAAGTTDAAQSAARLWPLAHRMRRCAPIALGADVVAAIISVVITGDVMTAVVAALVMTEVVAVLWLVGRQLARRSRRLLGEGHSPIG